MIRKCLGAVFLLAAVILTAGCISAETAEAGDTVSVYYTLTLEDGTVRESNVGKTPLEFVVGSGQMISGFDKAVNGMAVGETKTVTLSPAEAYGEITDDMIQEMPAAELEAKVGQTVSEGDSFRVTVNTGTGYQLAYIKILSVEGDTVFYALTGSDLAGEYLTFTITLDSIA